MRPASVVREEQREPGLERPEARMLSVEDLLRNVLAGKLRVPPFQHESKWKARDAQTLFDSIYRGYPIGALLLWQRHAGADRLSYGSLEVSAPDMNDAWWVVDGQQRVHALARVLAGKGPGSDGFALHFDLANDRFIRLARRSRETKDHVPLTEILDSERLLAWLRGHGIAGDARAIGLGKCIREYQLPVYVVRTTDEAVVREIYRRVTSTGRSMRDSDVFDAMHGARRGARTGGLAGLSMTLEGLGFGKIGAAMLLEIRRAIPAIAGSAPDLDALERALRSAINLLRQDAGIPSRTVLPYELPLIALTAFFRVFVEIHPRSRQLLARWVWRGALTDAHRTDPSHLRAALAAITPGDEHGSVQALLGTVPQTLPGPRPSQPFALASARCRIEVLALLDLRPRHLVTGEPITPNAGIKAITRHILASAPEVWRLHLANIILHPAVAKGLRGPLLEVRDASILASHAVTPRAHELLRQGDMDGFFAARAETLRARVEDFVARCAGWDRTDRPPLSALEIADED